MSWRIKLTWLFPHGQAGMPALPAQIAENAKGIRVSNLTADLREEFGSLR